MGLFDLFSKEARETAKSRAAYDECVRFRRERLLSFRSSAIQQTMFTYPDANLLLNALDRRFMVLLRSQGALLIGKFADDYFPRLDYVADDANLRDRSGAVSRFRKEVSMCKGNISVEASSKFSTASRWLSEKTTESFQAKGFAITGTAELKYLIGGSLFLNGLQIAKSSIWNPKPKGFFNACILDKVLQTNDRNPETQSLTFVTLDCDPVGGGQKMSYEILFNRSLMAFDVGARKQFMDTVVNLRDFLYSIEDYFTPNAPGADDDKLEYTFKDREEVLDSPDRDEDQSIESRYLL